MKSPEHNLVIAVFDQPSAAYDAVEALHAAHFAHNAVGMVTHPAEGEHSFGEVTIPPEAAVAGATAAGLAGATLGMAPVIPGQSVAGAAGLTFAAIVGYGMLARGITPVLTEAGVNEEEARYFETEYRDGRAIVVVKPGERVDEAVEILKAHGGRGKRAPAE
jgi:hypothetical protein